MTDEERAIAKRRAGAFVDAAFWRERFARTNATAAIPLALRGTIREMTIYSILAEEHEDARIRLGAWMKHEAAL